MKTSILVAFSFLFTLSTGYAAEPWEACLDNGDFTLNADVSFFKSVKVVKSGCLFRFTESEGRGRKLEVNVCDPVVKLADYAAINAERAETLGAGSSACPAPLFGADLGPTSATSPDFAPARAKIFEILQTIRKSFGPGADDLNVTKLSLGSAAGSEAKIACAKHLLDEYLNNCVAFTAKASAPSSAAPEKLSPGIHPANINPAPGK